MTSPKDQVYANPMLSVGAFRFNASVADVFQDMIERSVPGYGLLLQLIGVLAERYATENTNCYDLGCSLGAATLQLRRHVPASCHIVGIDNSAAMVERCRANIARDHGAPSVEIIHEDISSTLIDNASIAVLNFTLQFIVDKNRQNILNAIASGLQPGGVLILAEKICFYDNEQQSLMTKLHHDFKKHQGYSDLEISQKRAAIENVLVPNTQEEHIKRLKQAGFSNVQVCVRCLNFVAFLAIK